MDVGPGSYEPIDVHHKKAPAHHISGSQIKKYSPVNILRYFEEKPSLKADIKHVPAILQ